MSATTPSKIVSLLTGPWALLLFRLAMGALFIYSSLDKIASPAEFAPAVRAYKILPSELVPLFSVVLPWIQLVTGAFLLVGFRTRASAAALSLVLVVFLVALVSGVIRGLTIDCGCFKGGDESLGLWVILRDLVFLFMTGAVLLRDRGFATVDSLLGRSRAAG
jgi:putative oxidoreductase